MPKVRLTKSVIDGLKPSSADVVYWDESLAGFGVKVTPKGRKVFLVLYRTRDGFSRLRKYTIGPHGQTTLVIARAIAQRVLAARLDGKDPAAEKRQLRRKIIKDSVDEVVSEYWVRHVDAIRSSIETKRILNREILSRWSGRSIHDVSKHDVLKVLDEITDRGSPAMANRTLTVIRALFNWSIGRGLLEKSPCVGLSKPSPERARDRVLSDEELKLIIQAARQIGFPYGSIVEVLALTGQRRQEIAAMSWSEIDLEKRIWTIPSNRTKNKRTHMVHLAPEVIHLLDGLERTGDLAFSNQVGKPFNDFSRGKTQLDRHCGVADWVLHDLRRTAVSGMARLGTAPHVADRILNHQSGSISGVAAIYQRHEFLLERREASLNWARHADSLLPAQTATRYAA